MSTTTKLLTTCAIVAVALTSNITQTTATTVNPFKMKRTIQQYQSARKKAAISINYDEDYQLQEAGESSILDWIIDHTGKLKPKMTVYEEEEEEWEEEMNKKTQFWSKINKMAQKGSKSAQNALVANDMGLFDEEQWEVNAGVSGGPGGVQWNVGVSHSWDEDVQNFIPSTKKKIQQIQRNEKNEKNTKNVVFESVESELQCLSIARLLEDGVATFDELPESYHGYIVHEDDQWEAFKNGIKGIRCTTMMCSPLPVCRTPVTTRNPSHVW